MNTVNRSDMLDLIMETASIERSPEEIENMSLQELGLDSLDVIELGLAFEDKYQLQLDTDQLTNQSLISEILDTLKPMDNAG